jgi:hypothetical protein
MTPTTPLPDPLEELAAADARRAAMGYVTEAFAEAVLAGIEGDCFAHAAMFAALQELVGVYGEDPVARFVETLPEKVRRGDYTIAAKH